MSPSLAPEDFPDIDLSPLVDYMVRHAVDGLEISLRVANPGGEAIPPVEHSSSIRHFEVTVMADPMSEHGEGQGKQGVFQVLCLDGPPDTIEGSRGHDG